MKKLMLSVMMMCSVTFVAGQEYNLDTKNSVLSWKGYGEIGGFVQEGTIDLKEGALMMEEGKIISSKVVVEMESIKSNEDDLTVHLKKKDFFHVKKYPVASLKMITLEAGILTAELTIRGITKKIVIPVTVYNMGELVKVSGVVSIDRTVFEIKYNSSTYFQDLGNYAIRNEFDLGFDLSFAQK